VAAGGGVLSEAVDTDLQFALELAKTADAITMRAFRSADLRVETKADLTPVTAADRAVEQELRALIRRERPGDGVVGEEFGSSGEGGRRWFLDPIDGTKNFVRGIPVFATLIALERDGEMVVGVCSAPALGARWWAAKGQGAYARDGERIQVSGVAEMRHAQLSYDSVPGFEEHGMGDRFLALARRCARTRGFGDFWSHVLVAEGAVDVAVEPEVNPWDLAPLKVIVEEAGGRFTDLSGAACVDGGSAVSSNGLLHDEVLQALRPAAGAR
jgi:histidinol-phosphatase